MKPVVSISMSPESFSSADKAVEGFADVAPASGASGVVVSGVSPGESRMPESCSRFFFAAAIETRHRVRLWHKEAESRTGIGVDLG
jgi:hypothetical protein